MVIGLDIGSRAAKAVLMDSGGIVDHCMTDTGANPQRTGQALLDQLLENAGCPRDRVAAIVGTGYGRIAVPFATRTVTELTCHGRGVHFLAPAVRTVIDIGGQDSKAIHIDENGDMIDFVMNDRCAAGTGRFMEMAARAIETDVDGLSRLAFTDAPPCSVNSMCAVFAESEVISLLAEGHAKEAVAAAILDAFAKRVTTLVRRIGVTGQAAFVGGVAKNLGLKTALERMLNVTFAQIPMDPQMIGALGAAVIAKEMA